MTYTITPNIKSLVGRGRKFWIWSEREMGWFGGGLEKWKYGFQREMVWFVILFGCWFLWEWTEMYFALSDERDGSCGLAMWWSCLLAVSFHVALLIVFQVVETLVVGEAFHPKKWRKERVRTIGVLRGGLARLWRNSGELFIGKK